MSDGTLRFLPRRRAAQSAPAGVSAIVEPENSLHRDMLPALARLRLSRPRASHIWLTSHFGGAGGAYRRRGALSALCAGESRRETRIVE